MRAANAAFHSAAHGSPPGGSAARENVAMIQPQPGPAEEAELAEKIIEAMHALFGVHPGFRAVSAKGMVCEGSFRGHPQATQLTRALPFQGAAIPVTVRFSNFTGIPNIPDGDPNASPRGCALRFHLPYGASTDLITHSYDGFPARTAEEFLGFLQAVGASTQDAPHPTPLETFLNGHPAAKRFAEAAKPTPRSFATERYYSVDAFGFRNEEGVLRYGRYRLLPVAGAAYLEPEEAAHRPPNFLFDELVARMAARPAEYRLLVQVAEKGDPVDDATAAWPEGRTEVELGTLQVLRKVADSEHAQRFLAFDPARLVDGLELSPDPLVKVRSGIYAIAARRRSREQGAPKRAA